MELQGKIKLINETQEFGASGFRKREWVLSTDLDTDYPQHISLECHQDKVDLLDSYKVGDDVKVSLNIRGKEWTSPEGIVKYFNSIVSWRIEKIEEAEIPPVEVFNTTINKEDNPLPF